LEALFLDACSDVPAVPLAITLSIMGFHFRQVIELHVG